jgi:hypothetical protein
LCPFLISVSSVACCCCLLLWFIPLC